MIHSILPKITDSFDFKHSGLLVGYINVYNYSIFKQHPEIVKGFTLFTLDGIALVTLIRILFKKRIRRKSPDFSSYFTELFTWIESNGIKIGFIGGTSAEMTDFKKQIKSIYPDMKVVLCQNGYTSDAKKVSDRLQSGEIEFIILGMGSPKQELFALELRNNGYKGSIFTCGAFISQTAEGGRIYYPDWINRLNFRWLYRIYKQPELSKRYFIEYPIALCRVVSDFMTKDKVTQE